MKQLTKQQLEQVYREHPEWRLGLEAGKWYNYNGWLLCFVGVDSGIIRAYGIDLSDGEWSDEDNFGWTPKAWSPASDAEVAEAIIAEARKRGFTAGVEINNAALGFHDGWQKIEGDDIEWKGGHLNFGKRGTSIFHNGNWADVRESSATVEVGKWYKLPDNANFLFCVTELLSAKSAYGYGWCKFGEWHDTYMNSWGCEDVIPATHEEVEAALIAEAKRRYKKGDKIEGGCLGNGKFDFELTGSPDNAKIIHRDGKESLRVQFGYNSDCAAVLYYDGQWAAVVTPASTLAEDIQALREKYPDYNWTIVADAK